jgi:phosphatidylethanolamine-binding protein (PEBP) family uncharacterized protein
MAFQLKTSAFAPNGRIPDVYTCEGEEVPPPLAWNGAPAGTKSFALIVDDPDAPGRTKELTGARTSGGACGSIRRNAQNLTSL